MSEWSTCSPNLWLKESVLFWLRLASHAGVFRGAHISVNKQMLSVGTEEIQAPLKTSAWKVRLRCEVSFFAYCKMQSCPCYTSIFVECFHSHGQHLCKFIGTKERVWVRKELNSHRTGMGHQHGRRSIVLGHQYGCCDIMWKHSIFKNNSAVVSKL